MIRAFFLTLVLFTTMPAQAALLFNAGGPYTISEGDPYLLLIPAIVNPPDSNIAIDALFWTLNGQDIGEQIEAYFPVFWPTIVAVTDGGAPGDYDLFLTLLLRVCVTTDVFGNCIDVGFDIRHSPSTTLSITALNPVPVPGAFWLFVSALTGLAGFCRKHRK